MRIQNINENRAGFQWETGYNVCNVVEQITMGAGYNEQVTMGITVNIGEYHCVFILRDHLSII